MIWGAIFKHFSHQLICGAACAYLSGSAVTGQLIYVPHPHTLSQSASTEALPVSLTAFKYIKSAVVIVYFFSVTALTLYDMPLLDKNTIITLVL